MIQAVFSAAPGLRICLTHTLCLNNVLDCASCHNYVSVKSEASRGAGAVPGRCSVCVFLWVQVLKISCMNSSDDINTVQKMIAC